MTFPSVVSTWKFDGTEAESFSSHTNHTFAISWHPKKDEFVVAGHPNLFRHCRGDGKLLGTFDTGGEKAVADVLWNDQGTALFGRLNRSVVYWAKGYQATSILKNTTAAGKIAWLGSRSRLAIPRWGAGVLLWDPIGQDKTTLEIPHPAENVDWHEGRSLLAVSGGRRVTVLDDHGAIRGNPIDCEHRIQRLAWAPDGKRLVLMGNNRCTIVDRFSGHIASFGGHHQPMKEACFSPDGKWLSTASGDCRIVVRDTKHFAIQWSGISVPQDRCYTFSPSGKPLNVSPAKLDRDFIGLVQAEGGGAKQVLASEVCR